MKPTGKILTAIVSAAALGSSTAAAVSLATDGLGQALIFPYYTVRTAQGNAFNTYLSVANTTWDPKVIRVRLREGRNGRETLSFNLYLHQGDMWTAAVVPHKAGAKLVSADTSCTNPPMAASPGGGLTEVALSNASFSGANDDGMGEELDRVREGYVEMIEMATLDVDSYFANAIAAWYSPVPQDCSLVQGDTVVLGAAILPPSGGLMGTLTLINVASGMDFTVNADALASLTVDPIYRDHADPYPDYDATEVRPVSYIATEGRSYALRWARGVDAVSSVLMAPYVLNEYVRDRATASQTDWVVTFPTKRFYPGHAPLNFQLQQSYVGVTSFDRRGRGTVTYNCGFGGVCLEVGIKSASVLPMVGRDLAVSPVLGSKNTLTGLSAIPDSFESGWAELSFWAGTESSLTSAGNSTSRDQENDNVQVGAFHVLGLPTVGFMVRTFQNGQLSCSGRTCQGNYGGAFSHRFRRSVLPVEP